jgi:GTPase SAR1 family protein
MMPSDVTTENIALWGPPSSGKTYLIKAFTKELELYTEKDPDFDYLLLDEAVNKLVDPAVPEPAPNAREEGYSYRFLRTPKKGKSGAKYEVTSQSHLLNIRDLPGGWTVGAGDDPESDPKYEEALQSFLYSQHIIAVFDPTYGSADGTAELGLTPIPFAERSDYDRRTYAILFKKFVEQLLNNADTVGNIKQRFIALTVTKTDALSERKPPLEILSTKYGGEIRTFLKKYFVDSDSAHSTLPIVVSAFTTSSVGYYGGRTPNIDSSGHIKKPDRWMPYNAAAPFFWIFENIERKRLSRAKATLHNPLSHYVPYPRLRTI